MKHVFLLVAGLAAAVQLDAGLTYRIETITEGVRPHAFTGIVKNEGGQSRFEVTRSDEKMFETGSVMLSSSKDSVITVLNPAKKTYYVLDFKKIAATAAETQKQFAPWMKIAKPVVTIKSEGSGGLVEGYSTQRWLIDATIELQMRAPVASDARRFTTRSEIWTTEKLPAEASSILQNSRLPGDPVFDALRDAQSKMKGFPLKSVTVTKMTIAGSATSSTSRTTVTGIRRVSVPPSAFVLPAGYTRVDSPIDAMLATLSR